MLAKIFRGGLTYQGAVAVIAYLLNDRVMKGLSKVVKGDSELTLKIILQASKKFKWSWFSGVLSFSEMLSKDIINSIIKDFERTFFAVCIKTNTTYFGFYIRTKDVQNFILLLQEWNSGPENISIRIM